MIHSTGVIHLVYFEGFMNGNDYVKVLSDYVLPWMNRSGHKEDMILQQDNARYHTTFAAKEFCETNGINVLDWPAYSPHLNVIENMWVILKRYIRKRRP